VVLVGYEHLWESYYVLISYLHPLYSYGAYKYNNIY